MNEILVTIIIDRVSFNKELSPGFKIAATAALVAGGKYFVEQ